MDSKVILDLSLEIDKYFASLPNTQSEIMVATLSLISYKLKECSPTAELVLMEIARTIAQAEIRKQN